MRINTFWLCQFSEINGDSSQLKFVQIEKDIAQNLTCFNNKGSQNARIKWFKVNGLIKISYHLKTFIKRNIYRMGKNIQDKFTLIAIRQSCCCKERWGKMEATLVSGKSAFQVM